jgi:hypothetical protein
MHGETVKYELLSSSTLSTFRHILEHTRRGPRNIYQKSSREPEVTMDGNGNFNISRFMMAGVHHQIKYSCSNKAALYRNHFSI